MRVTIEERARDLILRARLAADVLGDLPADCHIYLPLDAAGLALLQAVAGVAGAEVVRLIQCSSDDRFDLSVCRLKHGEHGITVHAGLPRPLPELTVEYEPFQSPFQSPGEEADSVAQDDPSCDEWEEHCIEHGQPSIQSPDEEGHD